MAKAQLLPLRPPAETFEREIAALLPAIPGQNQDTLTH